MKLLTMTKEFWTFYPEEVILATTFIIIIVIGLGILWISSKKKKTIANLEQELQDSKDALADSTKQEKQFVNELIQKHNSKKKDLTNDIQKQRSIFKLYLHLTNQTEEFKKTKTLLEAIITLQQAENKDVIEKIENLVKEIFGESFKTKKLFTNCTFVDDDELLDNDFPELNDDVPENEIPFDDNELEVPEGKITKALKKKDDPPGNILNNIADIPED